MPALRPLPDLYIYFRTVIKHSCVGGGGGGTPCQKKKNYSNYMDESTEDPRTLPNENISDSASNQLEATAPDMFLAVLQER